MSRYETWNPVAGLAGRLTVEAFHDDYEYVRVLLRETAEEGRMLRIMFDCTVSYRNINESYRGRTWRRQDAMAGSLYLVHDSTWIASLVEESDGLLVAAEHTHYAIHTDEDCIDIASQFEPTVVWLS